MNAFNNLLTPAHEPREQRLIALDSWHRAFKNSTLRMNCTDSYHEELVRQADELDRLSIAIWEEWRDLCVEANQAYLPAVAGDGYRKVEAPRMMCLESIKTSDVNAA